MIVAIIRSMKNSTENKDQDIASCLKKRNAADYWARGMGLFSIAISILVAIYNYSYNRTVLQQHITPSLTCYAELAEMIRQNKPVAGIAGKDLLFTVENQGPLPIVSLSVDTLWFDYNKKSMSIPLGGLGHIEPRRVPGRKWIFEPEFEAGKLVHGKSIPGLADPFGWVQVFLFNLHYYRKSDMQDFRKTCIFFVDDGKLFSNSEYIKNPQYKSIMTMVSATEQEQKIDLELMKNAFHWRSE